MATKSKTSKTIAKKPANSELAKAVIDPAIVQDVNVVQEASVVAHDQTQATQDSYHSRR